MRVRIALEQEPDSRPALHIMVRGLDFAETVPDSPFGLDINRV